MPSGQKFTNNDDLSFDAQSNYEDCEFESVDFSQHSLKGVSYLDCTFNHCNMANQVLINGSFRGCSFKNCNMMGINWCSLRRLEYPQFESCKMNFSVFQDLKLSGIGIKNCSLIDADFSGADLSDSDFSGSNFAGANLNKADISGADLRSSKDYLFDIRVTKVKGTKFSFPYVISLLTLLGAEVEI